VGLFIFRPWGYSILDRGAISFRPWGYWF